MEKMKMIEDFRRLFLVFAVLIVAQTSYGAFKTVKVIYRNDFTDREIDRKELNKFKCHQPAGGEKEDGALWMKNVDHKSHQSYHVELDPSLFAEGGYYVIEGRYRGDSMKKGEKHWYGGGVVLRLIEKSRNEKPRWPAGRIVYGTTAWSHIFQVVSIKPNDVKKATLCIDQNHSSGDLFIDWVKISKAVEVPDSQIKPPVNEAAAKIPRGKFYGKESGVKYRGCMINPIRITEADIDDLGKWGVNLIRFSLSSRPKQARDAKGYVEMIEKRMDHLEKLMPALKRNGIAVIVHPPGLPQAKSSVYASSNLQDVEDFSALEKAWTAIAKRFKSEPNVIAYDILNEPYGIALDKWRRAMDRVVKAIRSVDPEKLIYNPLMTEPISNNMGYTHHMYSPHALTHQGVSEKVAWKYPGYINGVYWDKEQLRVALKPVIEYQEKYQVPVYIGEFSCIAWADGREKYIQDCIELFEEYGWDWTYHAFREWAPWSVEHEKTGPFKVGKAVQDTPAKKVLLEYFKKNKKTVR